MRLSVVFSATARQAFERDLEVQAPCSIAEAIRASGLLEAFPEVGDGLATGVLSTGVWGEPAPLDHLLAELDRVEVYRALTVDPKLARRLRFSKQGARAAGLFAKRRPGSKPGY
jgi:putative ubiquitin-RnfH superfamily antitoxin RatB of RatAB toxin-antitoxin module